MKKNYYILLLFFTLRVCLIAQNCPVSAQEMTTWQRSPITSKVKTGFLCQGMSSDGKMNKGERWRRGMFPSANYPYIGPYSSFDSKVIKWQLGQAKNCGLKTLFTCLICENYKGRTYINENDFEKVIDQAEKMNYPVAVMDDSFFRQKLAQSPENVVFRLSNFLKKYGKRPGYYKINGQPVILLCQIFDFLSVEQIDEMLGDIEKNVGDVYWVLTPRGNLKKLLKVKRIDAFKVGHSLSAPNSLNNKDGVFKAEAYAAKQKQIINECHKNNKKAWTWIYPGFDNRDAWGTGYFGKNKMSRQSSQSGKVLKQLLEISKNNNADHIVITSWSCTMENTQLEAGWDFDGYFNDPFARQKIIAAFCSRKWHDPPKPARSIVDPLLYDRIFGEDGIGPEIKDIKVHNGDLIVFAEDDKSKVKSVKIWLNGSAYVLINSGKIKSKGFKLDKAKINLRDKDFAEFKGKLIFKNVLPYNRLNVWTKVIANGNLKAPTIDFPTEPLTFKWEGVNRKVFKMYWRHCSHSLVVPDTKSFTPPSSNYECGLKDPARYKTVRYWEALLPIWHFGTAKSNKVKVDGAFHYIALIHPEKYDFEGKTAAESLYKGRFKIFRMKLPEVIQKGDYIIAVGIDEHGNMGQPEVKRVNYLR